MKQRIMNHASKAVSLVKQQQPKREFSQLAENQIAAWLQQGGAKNLQNKGQKIKEDKNRRVANALGVGNDYIHSKILADNNFKPESVERRIAMDKQWEELQLTIQKDYETNQSSFSSIQAYASSAHSKKAFGEIFEELDQKAKKVNEAIISDSLRFNGRSPVPHARRFRMEERIEEILSKKE